MKEPKRKRQPPERLWIAQCAGFDNDLSCTWNCQPIFEPNEIYRDIEYVRKDVNDAALAAKDALIAQLRDNIGELIGENNDYIERCSEKDGQIAQLLSALRHLQQHADSESDRRVAAQAIAAVEIISPAAAVGQEGRE